MNENFAKIPYISSSKNENIKELKALLSSPKDRKREKVSVCLGEKLSKELLLYGKKIEKVFVSESALHKFSELSERLIEEAKSAYIISDSISDSVCDQKTPQGIFSVFSTDFEETKTESLSGKLVILDGIQDPGNMGTIIRCAEAFGISAVLLSADCCEAFSPKAIRSSMGSCIRLPIIVCEDLSARIDELKKTGYTVYGAVLSDNENDSLKKISFPEKSAVVIGNEGGGIREETLNAISESVYIPMKKNGAESLNAALAAGIIMWEMAKKEL